MVNKDDQSVGTNSHRGVQQTWEATYQFRSGIPDSQQDFFPESPSSGSVSSEGLNSLC